MNEKGERGREGGKYNPPRPRYRSLLDWSSPRPRISVYPATSGRETLETKLALLGAGCRTKRVDCGHQIAQLFKICHEQLKSSLNQSSYLWSASPRANLSRTSSNILSPRTVITCLMGRQEQKRTVYNTIPCIQKTTTTRKKKLFKYYDPCKYNQKFSKSNLNFILFSFIQLQLFARATTFFRQSAGFSLGLKSFGSG